MTTPGSGSGSASPHERMSVLKPTVESVLRDFLPDGFEAPGFVLYLARTGIYLPEGVWQDTLEARAVDDHGLITATFSPAREGGGVVLSSIGFGARDLSADVGTDVAHYYQAVAEQCELDPSLLDLSKLVTAAD